MSIRRIQHLILVLAIIFLARTARAEDVDVSALGGDLTAFELSPTVLLELPSPNIRSDDAYQFHLVGHGDFHGSFDGISLNEKFVLGPNFNHTSCVGCHVANFKGPVKFSSRPPGSPMLVKVALRGLNADKSPRNVPKIGEQLQDHTIQGKSRFKIKLAYINERGRYPDGTKYVLRKPSVSFDISALYNGKVVTSTRMTPPIIGMGLLEAIPDQDIINAADPNDANGDGISGRVSYVVDLVTKAPAIGRFGFRATHVNVKQQSAAAFFNDMGMTSSIFTDPTQQQEVSDEVMDRLVFYLQAAGVPPARNQSDSNVVAGKALFQQVNCSGCHTMTQRTGNSDVIEVANQEFHPFTDLLLHDMGKGLSDTRPEFSASGKEWRTTPLWGIGLFDILGRGKPGFMHDGRARTLEEAILWHDGEAKRSRDAFKALSKTEREQLIQFLKSI